MDFEYQLNKKNLSQVELKCMKMKDLEAPELVYLDRKVVELGCKVDNHGDMLDITSLVLDVAAASQDVPAVDEQQDAYLLVQETIQAAYAADSPIKSQGELEQALSGQVVRERVRSALKSRLDSGWVYKVVIDKTKYELVNKKKGEYYVALTVEEHGMLLGNRTLPSRVLSHPLSMAKPWGDVSEDAIQRAAVVLRQKREKAAANEAALLQLDREAAGQLK